MGSGLQVPFCLVCFRCLVGNHVGSWKFSQERAKSPAPTLQQRVGAGGINVGVICRGETSWERGEGR